MSKELETRKICNITDDVTAIRYKIIHRRSADRYEIWTQYKDGTGKLRRNRITFSEALAVETDKEKTIAYVKDVLVAKHINIYANKDILPAARHPQKEKQSLSIKESHVQKSYANHDCHDLESLFIIWQKAQSEEPDEIWVQTRGSAVNITKNHFRRDGIIDEEIYRKEKTKVLFISSEANDDEYNAKSNSTPSTVNDYRRYNDSRHDDWKGKMRERLSELYKVLSHTERNSMLNPDAALHFAVMDINKRGGGALIGKDNHIEYYCRQYASFVRRELEIINPDVIGIIGLNLYNMDLHCKYLGAIKEADKCYFILNEKKVPILSLWQTSYYQGRCEVAPGYEDNRIIGKQVTRAIDEMRRFGL